MRLIHDRDDVMERFPDDSCGGLTFHVIRRTDFIRLLKNADTRFVIPGVRAYDAMGVTWHDGSCGISDDSYFQLEEVLAGAFFKRVRKLVPMGWRSSISLLVIKVASRIGASFGMDLIQQNSGGEK